MVKTSLTPGNRHILEHVARFRISTVDAIHALFYADKTRDGAMKAANRLVTDGLLQSFDINSRKIYQLTEAAASLIGSPRTSAEPLGVQSLRECFAMLCFCCLGEVKRKSLTPSEFRDAFPEFADAKGIAPWSQHYYAERRGDAARLGRATVDSGADTARVLRKCREIIHDAKNTPVLREIIAQRLFVLVVLTAEESKRCVLADAIRKDRLRSLVEVEVIPDLSIFL